MQQKAKSIRSFIGSKDFDQSRKFYQAIGFEEKILSHDMSVFAKDGLAFYLQAAYVKDWIENTMLFLEVDDVEAWYEELKSRDLPATYPGAKLSAIRNEDWGRECFLHDPAGNLWHIGQFNL